MHKSFIHKTNKFLFVLYFASSSIIKICICIAISIVVTVVQTAKESGVATGEASRG